MPQHSVSPDGRFASDMWTLPAVDPSRVALVGLRSLDTRERERIRELGIRAYTMSDIDRIGIERAIRESLTQIAGPGFVHVSLDMDALDPEVAPGVGTPVRGGLSYREAHLALELVAESGLAGSFEVVEVNPILDRANETAAARSGARCERAGQDDPLTSSRPAAGRVSPGARRPQSPPESATARRGTGRGTPVPAGCPPGSSRCSHCTGRCRHS